MKLRTIKGYDTRFAVFTKKEISALFTAALSSQINTELTKHGVDPHKDPAKAKQIIAAMSSKGANDRDGHEIFASVFNYQSFYGEDAEIMYEVKGFDPKRNRIQSLEDLNRFRAGTFTDFGVLSGGVARLFQMKRYRGAVDSNSLSAFIKKSISHYSFKLSGMNLLVLLQSHLSGDKQDKVMEIPNNLFEEVHKNLKSFAWTFTEHILVSYLEQDMMFVIVQIYPELTEARIPFIFPSKQLESF